MNNACVMMAQMAVFRNFVQLALEWRKPLILHVRMATVEAIQVMSEVRIRYTCYVYILSNLSENNAITGRRSILLADSPPLLQ